MKTTLLIDGNSIGYANHHGAVLTANGMQVQAIYGFISTMKALKNQYGFDAEMIVLWDGKASFRYELCPEYKANRTNDAKKILVKENYTKQKPYIERFLQYMGITQMTSFEHEADDLAGILCKKMNNEHERRIVLITGDRDWLQLVRQGVEWADVRSKDRRVNIHNFKEKTGYSNPIAFLESKCLQGDNSDNVSGVGGIGEVGALKLLNEYGSVRKFWQLHESGSTDTSKLSKAQRSLLNGDGRKLFERNLKIMQLINPKPLVKDQLKIVKGKFDKDELIDICQELYFTSFVNTFDVFFQPFKGN